MRIPLYSVPLKNPKLKASFSVIVDGSTRFGPTLSCAPSNGPCTYTYNLLSDSPGAQIAFDQAFGPRFDSAFENFNQVTGYYDDLSPELEQDIDLRYSYYIEDGAGTHHNLLFDNSKNNMVLRAIDGSGYSLTMPSSTTYQDTTPPFDQFDHAEAYDANGSHWHSVDSQTSQFIDANGNVLITYSFDQSGIGHYVDSFNRDLIIYGPALPNPSSLCPDLRDSTQLAERAQYVSFPGPSDVQEGRINLLVCYTTIKIHTNLLEHGGDDLSVDRTLESSVVTDTYKEVVNIVGLPAIQSIKYPDGTYLGFTYDTVDTSTNSSHPIAYGNLTSVHLRTGAVISYSQQPTESCVAHTDPFHGYSDFQGRPPYEPFHNSVFTRTVTSDGSSQEWGYSYINDPGVTTTIESKPDSNSTRYTFPIIDAQCTAYETKREDFTGYIGSLSGATLLNTVETSYYQFLNITGFTWQSWLNGSQTNIAFPHVVKTTPVGGDATTTTYTYDAGFTGAQPFRFQQNGSSPAWSAQTENVIWAMPKNVTVVGPDGNGNSLTSTKTTDYKWETSGTTLDANLLNTPSDTTISGTGGNSATTTFGYDAAGNQTSRTTTGPQGGTHSVSTQYNSNGQPTQVVDGMEIDYAYEDSLSPFPTKITFPSVNVTHEEHFIWDHNTFQTTSHTDQNSVQSTYQYHGPLGQLSLEVDASGTSVQTTTSYDYSNPLLPKIFKDFHSSGDGLLVATTQLDGLGRPIKVTLPDGSVIDTQYDPVGNVLSVSNPYYVSVGPGASTTYTYDGLNRKLSENYSDGNSKGWAYSGYSTAYMDEANRRWQRTTDALGRLANVVERGTTGNSLSLLTSYNYDALGNLTDVNQTGVGEAWAPKPRHFTYDSLSNLLTAYNPETGTVTYSYLSQGNPCSGNPSLPCSKTDANSVVTGYSYDGLNRMLNETASDGSYASTLYYDVAPALWGGTPFVCAYGVGRVCQADHIGFSGTATNYDPLGRVASTLYASITDGPPYKPGVAVQYDAAGDPTLITYPDQLQISQSWNFPGKIGSIADVTSGGSGTTYLTGPATCPGGGSCASYWPSGAVNTENYSNGVTQTFTLNSRLQPCHSVAFLSSGGSGSALLDRQSFYNSSASSPCGYEAGNNGNIYSIRDNLNSQLNQTFSYDGLNRITSGSRSDSAYNQTYGYDSFGNMGVQDSSSVSYEADPAGTNRLLRSHSGSMSYGDGVTTGDFRYDSSGALTYSADGVGSPHTYQHDSEGRLVSIDYSQTATYAYNGLGERAYKVTPSGWTNYVYLNGQPMAETSSTADPIDYIYANGQKIAMVQGSAIPMMVLKGTRFGNGNLSVSLVGGGQQIYTQIGMLQAGDVLSFDERVPKSDNGIYANGGTVFYGTGQPPVYLTDEDGIGEAGSVWTDGAWHHRVFQIGNALAGQYIGAVGLTEFGDSSNSGDFEIDYAHFMITRANGTVVPFTAQSMINGAVLNPGVGNTGFISNLSLSISNGDLTYFVDDHLGSTQMELSSSGSVMWQGQFTPFGQEIVNGQIQNPLLGSQNADGSTMHYKFTGKERDQESGNDYFGARYYASTMGRFMSPDWDSSPVAIPYADRTNPQSFNLYSYAGNNPLSRTDPDGHCTNGGQQKGFFWCLFNDSDQDAAQARQNLAQYKNISINGKTPADAAKGLSNTQTVQLDRSVFNYISSQAMSSPGMVLALALVPGAAEELVPAEAAAAADSGSLLDLNKSLASQEQMGELAAGKGNPIAGAGTPKVLRDADRLAAQYGGQPGDWQKVASENYNPGGAKGGGFETHAYQNVKTGQVVEMKSKMQ